MKVKMDMSPHGVHLLANEESIRYWVYDDHDGKPVKAGHILMGRATFGIGHLVKPGESFPHYPAEASRELVDKVFHEDLKGTVSLVNDAVRVPLNQNQFDALCMIAFNLGGPQFRGSTFLRLLNQGRYDLTDDHFMDWRYDDHRKPVLLARRKREAALLNTPVEKAPPAKEAPSKPTPAKPVISSVPASKPEQKPKADSSPPPEKSKK